jgi:hypothetical protein
MKIDTDNTNPLYWEKILESHGLGERQLGLQEEPEENEDTISLEDLKTQITEESDGE